MGENDQPLNVIYLFGAGASHDAGIPIIGKMTSDFLIAPFEEASKYTIWDIDSGIDPDALALDMKILSEVTSKFYKKMDLELIMSLLLRLEDEKEKELLESKYSQLKKINEDDLKIIKTLIQGYIRKKCESINSIEYLWPLEGLSNKNRLKIFTLNYDGTIEIFCEQKGIKYTDGFDPDWNTERFDDKTNVHLYKLHGSLYWFKTESNKIIKIPIKGLKISEIRYLTDEQVSEMMIYPALNKNKGSGIYSWLDQQFKDQLKNSDICVIIGYSFRDDDIRESIIESMSTNNDLWLIIVSPHASKHKDDVFIDDEKIRSRILTMDMDFKTAITDRALSNVLTRIEAPRKKEIIVKRAQSSDQVRHDQDWNGVLHTYTDIGFDDRVKLIVRELSSSKFIYPNNNFPDCIEGIVLPKSLEYMFEYHKKGKKEELEIWKKIFLEGCIALEYRYFTQFREDRTLQINPISKNELPFFCMDGGNNPFGLMEKMIENLNKINEYVTQVDSKEKISKLISAIQLTKDSRNLDFNDQEYGRLKKAYEKEDFGIKKSAKLIVDSLL
ncbi:MAG: SIR2 family protein [Thaumarchaeota archaeon]|nr:SIR2 family protein [Nitrososphaerota archaeon]